MAPLATLPDLQQKNTIYSILQDIANDMSSHKLLYQNEQQFQFDFAWRINKRIDTSKLEVLLEYNTYVKMPTDKKTYTDIVIRDKNDHSFIAIELKYKKQGAEILDNNNNIIDTLEHDGAVNLGRFDYLWDIHRIEDMKKNASATSSKPDKQLNKLSNYVCGYAIMFTNDNSYWKTNGNNCSNNMSLSNQINKIAWNATKKGSAQSILDSDKYFKVSLKLNPNPPSTAPIEQRYLPLTKKYDFNTKYNVSHKTTPTACYIGLTLKGNRIPPLAKKTNPIDFDCRFFIAQI